MSTPALQSLPPLPHKFILFFILIATPLARGSVEGWAVALIHLVTGSAVMLYLLERCLRWDWKFIRTPLDIPLLTLLGLALVSTLFSTHRYTSAWSWVLLLDCVLIYYWTIHIIRTRTDLKQLIGLVASVALFLSALGFFKLIGANPFPWWEYGKSHNSLSSVYVNRNHMAGYLEMAIPLLLGYLLNGISRVQRMIIIFAATLLFMAHIFTLSRGGWIGLLIGMTFMILILFAKSIAKNRKLLFWCSTGVLFCFVTIISSTNVVKRVKTLEEGEDNPTLVLRMRVWRGTIDMIRDYPVFGSGPGTFTDIFTQYQLPGRKARYMMAHNDYLHFTSEVGLGLIGIVLWMGVVFYRHGLGKLKHPSRLVRGATLGAMAGITAILVHSISDFNLHVPANAILFTILAAVAMAPPPITGGKHGAGMSRRIFGPGAVVPSLLT
jgi:O-antigen ligase